ncbi:glycosyltransferase [Ferrimicrobium sp.]|uniref:glycosyltransferase family 4 protein n=1 Tax=Ferrimicrobium sp. TaxID=2926050 RepID=UPI002602949F|nr:glycosyltransferase [Ferrimicrobium sp.]
MTIATNATMAPAMALTASLAESNPSVEVTVLMVDRVHHQDLGAKHRSGSALHVVGLDALPIDEILLFEFATVFTIEELGIVLRPWALALVLGGEARTALYLSPDAYVSDRLDEFFALVETHGVVVTPRFGSLPLRDGLLPTEEQILADGFFEEGFLGVGRQRQAALEFWQERVMADFASAVEGSLLGGRRWFDIVVHLLDAYVLRDEGYSLAYWNLHEREIRRVGEGYSVNGVPARTLRFKGYCASTPWLLSEETRANPRVLLSESPGLHELCERYRAALAGQNGAASVPAYLVEELSDGTLLTPRLRHLFRLELTRARASGEEPPPPPGMGNDAAFVAWWREPAFPETLVNRFLYSLWRDRPDLQTVFANPVGGDEGNFLQWAWMTPDDSDLVETPGLLPAKNSFVAPLAKQTPGVNLVGYFSSGLGVGEVARLLVDGVGRAGVPYTLYNSQKTVGRLQADFVWEASGDRYGVTIATVTAEQLPVVRREMGRSLLADCYLVGIWAWEVADFPDYPEALTLVDEIWALSEFSRQAIAARTPKPVHVVPVPIRDPGPHQPLDRGALSLPEGPYFLFVFDYLSVFERKNPLGVVRAFGKAFHEGEGPFLVIKSINGDHCRADREHLREVCGGRSDVYLIEEYLPTEVVSSLMGEASAYVSLHRAEGLGLTLAEAMARGRPVIGTGYSGNLEFMNPGNSLLVDYKLLPIGPGIPAYPESSVWADPDLDAAGATMRWVIQHPEEARQIGRNGRASVLEQMTFDRLVSFLEEQLSPRFKGRSGGSI